MGPSTFGSWPRQLNGSLRYQRVVPQARTMSEPIMVVSNNENHIKVDKISPAETSSSGPGPPKRIPLTLQRKITPIESSPPDIPIIFVLGKSKINLKYLRSNSHTVQLRLKWKIFKIN